MTLLLFIDRIHPTRCALSSRIQFESPLTHYVQYTGSFDEELISVLPQSLRYICHNGAGYDNIDISACSQRNIAVSSTPVAVNNATADVGIFLMLGALRQAYVPLAALRAGEFVRL